jgi:hemerythrin-like domain-containing protein
MILEQGKEPEMQARAPLMIEHRLIERMIALIRNTLERIRSTGAVDPLFVDAAVDFFRFYADRTHHGKEEDILFRDLRSKKLSADDLRMMNELIEEHAFGRVTVQALVEANTRYRNGDASSLADVAKRMETLVGFYPGHIAKEDKVFFPASRAYFTDGEDQAVLAEFHEFDRKVIHEKYTAVIEALGG